MDGWIKIHRKLLDWEWYDDNNVVRVFLHLLLTANFETKRWRGIVIERGQLVTSINELANDTNLTPKQTRTALEKLKSTNEIDTKGANKYTLITICKYDTYQGCESAEGQTNGNQRANEGQTNGNQRANEGQTNGNQRATTKEIKNDNKEKNDNNILGEKTKQMEQVFQNGTELDFAENEKKEKSCAKKETKHKYGEYQNVKLTDEEFAKLKNKYGDDAEKIINYFDAQIEMKGYKYKSHYLAILDWGAKAFYEQKKRSVRAPDTSERDNRNLDGIW